MSTGPRADEGRTPRFARGKARAAALRASAGQVIAERGYEAATMTEIAARAAASIGSLYQYYPTKELIAAEVHAEYLDELNQTLGALGAKSLSPAAMADTLFDTLTAFLARYPAFPALAARRNIETSRKLASRARLEESLEQALASMKPRPAPEVLPGLAVMLLQQIKMVVSLQGSGREEDRHAIDHIRTMVGLHMEHLASGTRGLP
jgi:AcrR family transcriptional regulator